MRSSLENSPASLLHAPNGSSATTRALELDSADSSRRCGKCAAIRGAERFPRRSVSSFSRKAHAALERQVSKRGQNSQTVICETTPASALR